MPKSDRKAAVSDKMVCVVVLGTGRYGTPAATRILQNLGVPMETASSAMADEAPGRFSPDAFIAEANQELIDQSGIKQYLPVDGFDIDESIKIEIEKYIQEKLRSNEIWGFFDTNTSVLLRVYKEIFKTLNIAPKYVLCVGSPSTVVNYLTADYGMDAKVAQLLWLQNNMNILAETNLDLFVLHSDELPENPDKQIDALSKYIFGKKPPGHIETEPIHAALKNEIAQSSQSSPANIFPLVDELYAALRNCDGSEFDRASLLETAEKIRSIEEVFLPWGIAAAKKTSDQKEKLEHPNAGANERGNFRGFALREEPAGKYPEIILENDRLNKELSLANMLLDETIKRCDSSENELKILEKKLRMLEKENRSNFLKKSFKSVRNYLTSLSSKKQPPRKTGQ